MKISTLALALSISFMTTTPAFADDYEASGGGSGGGGYIGGGGKPKDDLTCPRTYEDPEGRSCDDQPRSVEVEDETSY